MKDENEKKNDTPPPPPSEPPSPKASSPQMVTPSPKQRGVLENEEHLGSKTPPAPEQEDEDEYSPSTFATPRRVATVEEPNENERGVPEALPVCPLLLGSPVEQEEEEAVDDNAEVPETQVQLSPTGSLVVEESAELTPTQKEPSPLPTHRPVPTPVRAEYHQPPQAEMDLREGWGGAHLVYTDAASPAISSPLADDGYSPAASPLADDGYSHPFEDSWFRFK